MKTEQVNLRLELDLVAALEEAARKESLDRATIIRKLLRYALSQRRLDRALQQYQRGEISIGRAAEEAELSLWEIMDLARLHGIAHPLDPMEVELQLRTLSKSRPRVAERSFAYGASRRTRPTRSETLPDRAPSPGGVLLVGINPSPVSVRAEHYYQGRLGKRLWRRLGRLGLAKHAVPGAEDDAFVAAGNGLTDVVKRATRSAEELSRDELRRGAETLREKIRSWQPGLILFAFKGAARAACDASGFTPGTGPTLEGVPTFLLSGPYAPRNLAERNDEELLRLLGDRTGPAEGRAMTQRVTEKDLQKGIIRLPKDARRFFPRDRTTLAIVLRGRRLTVAYDPRLGPDRERSGVLRIGRETLERLVGREERLQVSKTEDGSIVLD